MEKVDKIISKLNKSIKNLFSDFSGVYLYGSCATNSSNENSDIDIVALFNSDLPREKRMDLWTLIGQIEAEMDITLDLHPMTIVELKKNPIYYEQVVGKGIYYGV